MTEVPAAPSWQERIGGRWAISWQAYAAGAILNTLILGLTGGQIGASSVHPRDVPAWLGIGVLASLAVGVWALIADVSFMRTRRVAPVPVWMSVGFHLGVGLLYGSIVVLVGDAVIAPSPEPQVERILVIGLIGLWWGLTAALVLEARDRFNRDRSTLIDQAVQIELAAIDEREATARLRQAIEQDVSGALDGVREDVDRALHALERPSTPLLPIEEWWGISASLRETADSAVRPLSHRLWEATDARYAAPGLGRVLTRLFLYQSFAPLPTMTILAIGYLPAASYRLGIVVALAATLVMAAGAGLILMGANALMRSWRRAHVVVFVGTLLVTQAYALGYLMLLDRLAGASVVVTTEAVGGALAVGISVVLPAAAASLNGSRAELLERFRGDTDRARIEQIANAQQLASVARAAARQLHGTVQTRLISCSVAIEQASRSGDIGQFRRALEASLAILDAPFPDPTADTSPTVGQEILRVCAPWEGLCVFDVSTDETAAALQGPVALAAGRVVEEAVANACRHGEALQVLIDARVTDGPVLRLVVDDDGHGPTGGTPGLGTAMMAAISGGRVRLEGAPVGGARLTVELPLDA